METPESIRTSLIPGEWVLSIDLSDVLPQVEGVPVHLPPFRTSHSPQVFTMIVKEVKLMALSRVLRLHQYWTTG